MSVLGNILQKKFFYTKKNLEIKYLKFTKNTESCALMEHQQEALRY